MPLDEKLWDDYYVIFATKKGMVRKNKLIDVAKSGKRELRNSGKVAIKLDENDSLIGVKLCSVDEDILLSSSNGKYSVSLFQNKDYFSRLNSSGVGVLSLKKKIILYLCKF